MPTGRKPNANAPEIVEMYNSGATYKEIMEAFNLTEQTVWRILKRNNVALVRREDLHSSTRGKIKASMNILSSTELSAKQKAQILGLSLPALYNWLALAGLKPEPKPRPDWTHPLQQYLSLGEAAEWAAENNEELGLNKAPDADTLKRAVQDGRLVAVKRWGIWLTNVGELKTYLENYHPKRTRPNNSE